MTTQLETMRVQLSRLGFKLGHSLGGLSQGASIATASDGTRVVLKWTSDETMANRYGELLPALDELRARGVPVPEYLDVIDVDGGTLSVQQFLPGRSMDNPSPSVVDQLVAYITAKAGIQGPKPAIGQSTWGAFVVNTLIADQNDVCMHEPLRSWGPRCVEVLERIEVVGASSNQNRFPDDGLVHFDLHTDNILISDGMITGIIDWEEACAGDHLYDLVQFAFDLDGHGQPIWDIVDATDIEPQVLRAYVALLVLKCTSAAIQYSPKDVPRQLDRAERVFERFGA